jgi:hypothetical protein
VAMIISANLLALRGHVLRVAWLNDRLFVCQSR